MGVSVACQASIIPFKREDAEQSEWTGMLNAVKTLTKSRARGWRKGWNGIQYLSFFLSSFVHRRWSLFFFLCEMLRWFFCSIHVSFLWWWMACLELMKRRRSLDSFLENIKKNEKTYLRDPFMHVSDFGNRWFMMFRSPEILLRKSIPPTNPLA